MKKQLISAIIFLSMASLPASAKYEWREFGLFQGKRLALQQSSVKAKHNAVFFSYSLSRASEKEKFNAVNTGCNGGTYISARPEWKVLGTNKKVWAGEPSAQALLNRVCKLAF